MTRTAFKLALAPGLLLAGLLLQGCPHSDQSPSGEPGGLSTSSAPAAGDALKVSIVDGKLRLPAASLMGQRYADARLRGPGIEDYFVQFDGKYPEGWPAGFKLPEGSWTQPGHPREIPRREDPMNKDVRTFLFVGVVKLPQKDVYDYFKAAIPGLGLKVTSETSETTRAATLRHPAAAGEMSIAGGALDDSEAPAFSAEVWESEDTDGYTCYNGRVVLGKIHQL